MEWYYIAPETLIKMGINCKEVNKICLWIKNDTVRIACFLYGAKTTEKQQKIVRQLKDFIISNFPDIDDDLQLSYNANDYREKFQYMEHIMDKLKAEFRV